MLCCGNTAFGQLGLGGVENETIDSLVENTNIAAPIKQISAGLNHTLFLAGDGTVYSCGCNDFDQLGHHKHRKRPELIDALNVQENIQVSCGLHFSAVLSINGRIFIFGSVSGNPSKTDALYFPKPVLLSGFPYKVLQFATGYHHLIALTEDGTVYSFGLNDYGQLGLGNFSTPVVLPTPISSFRGVPLSLVVCGAYHSLLLTKSGSVFTFGANKFGQLGINATKNQSYPHHVKQLDGLQTKYAACGENHTIVVTLDGGVFTFGAGMYGQLGHGTTNNESLPRKVFELMGTCVSQVACGRCHTLAFAQSSGRLYSFGIGRNGQLGIEGFTGNNLVPTLIKKHWVAYSEKMDRSQVGYVVLSIAAGGDQTFVTFTKPAKPKRSLDYRFLMDKRSLPTLTLQMARDFVAVTAQGETHVSSEIKRLISVIFGAETCLNGSFLQEGYHGVDLQEVINVFEKLRSISGIVQNMIASFIEKMIKQLSTSPPCYEALRIYITLPFCHLLENQKYLETIICPFSHAVCALSVEASRVLDHWFEDLRAPYFDRVIQIYKPIVLTILKVPPSTNQVRISEYQSMLRSTLNLLSKLHQISTQADREIVSYDAFYIPELNEIINVQADYIEWVRRDFQSGEGPIAFCEYPFVFDGVAKSQLLQVDARMQRQSALNNAIGTNIAHAFGMNVAPEEPVLHIIVSRENLVSETIDQLDKCADDDLKKSINVIFIGEEAMDAGGVKKEFFMLLIRELLDPKYGMFTYYEETRCIWFNESSFEDPCMYRLVGKVCGLAIYNDTIIDLPFPLVLYKKLLKTTNPNLEDVKDISLTTYRSLKEILAYENDDFEETFCLNFAINKDFYGQITTVDLVPNGKNIAVTKTNREEYVNAYIDYLFNKSVEKQFNAFYGGFHQVISMNILKFCHPSELMAMVIGSQNYDFHLMEKLTQYKREYYPDHPVIRWFWEVFHSLSLDVKKKFLIFLTGSDRIPIMGMKHLKFIIQPTYGGDNYYPVAHTCFNLLDLPKYSSKQILRSRLLEAIEYNRGFTLV